MTSSKLDKSLDAIISDYGPSRVRRHERRRVSPYASKSSRVFVGNLPFHTKWQELKDLCSEYGDVKRASIIEENGRSKGCAFVTFSNNNGATACIDGLNGQDLDGRKLRVNRNNTTDKSTDKSTDKFLPNNIKSIVREVVGQILGQSGSSSSSRDHHSPPEFRVHVANLPFSTKWQELKDLCRQFGSCSRVTIPIVDGRSKGYATVCFDTEEAAISCVKGLNGNTLEGRNLNVSIDENSLSSFQSSQSGRRDFRVHVGNLPWKTKWQELKDLCNPFGNCLRVFIPVQGGQSKGYAIVSFASAEGARKCVEGLKGIELDGRTLSVKMDKRAMAGGSNSSNVVYVGNLPYSVDWQDLKELCSTYGFVTRAEVNKDDSGKSKGFGTVRFASKSDANVCVSDLNGQSLEGRVLNVHLDMYHGVPYIEGEVKVYVGNLPYSVTWRDLKDMCTQFGGVRRVEIEKNDNGRSQGRGIVTFAGAGSATSCIANLDGKQLRGRALVVKFDRYNNSD